MHYPCTLVIPTKLQNLRPSPSLQNRLLTQALRSITGVMIFWVIAVRFKVVAKLHKYQLGRKPAQSTHRYAGLDCGIQKLERPTEEPETVYM